ncbi:GntR family transcriptional regulator [Croceibacterium ferulae]|uniref:GntR family transcriptional regulator n=1 Tax=Croceibacterium ferulae TaxID=1854641 RepID=UPI000EB2AFAD|nr:GntR family transcriptional regulator [Croceibacterium ferulae]
MSVIDRIGALEPGGSGPLYLQLQQLIRSAIQRERLAPATALPSERDLTERYSMSRVTVRRALDGLVEDGMLERRQGAGTFVARRPEASTPAGGRVEKNFALLTSFSEDMRARGLVPGNEWIARMQGAVTPKEALSLNLSPGSPVFRFQRIRFADGMPMAFEASTVAGYALHSLDDVTDSLYDALRASGNRPVRALQSVRALGFDKEQASRLGVAQGHAGLFIERRSFLTDGRPVEVTHSYYRGDAYDLVAELSDP